MTNSPPHRFSSILLFSKVRYQQFCWKQKNLLIKQISYWLVTNCLKFYWLLICWTPNPDPHALFIRYGMPQKVWWTDTWMHATTDNPKPICPFNFFEVSWGHKNSVNKKYLSNKLKPDKNIFSGFMSWYGLGCKWHYGWPEWAQVIWQDSLGRKIVPLYNGQREEGVFLIVSSSLYLNEVHWMHSLGHPDLALIQCMFRIRIRIVYWWNAETTITHQDLWLGN